MKELEQIAAALDQGDYRQAAQLLRPLLKQNTQNPQLQLYAGRVYEGMGHTEKAEVAYRKILKMVTNPKIIRSARQGLERLQQEQKERRQAAIAQASNVPENSGSGFLLIAPIPSDQKGEAARHFAKIMDLDPYTANLQLPSRTWKLYRTGAMAELAVYGQELKEVGIMNFVISLNQLEQIQVFQVQYLQTRTPNVTVICQNSNGQIGELSFQWNEATQFVEGLLPIFENVVDLGVRNKLQRKEKTQDYAQVHDFHLPKRGCILRFCDRLYQFNKGVSLNVLEHPELPQVYATTRLKWNALTSSLKKSVKPAFSWTDFSGFGPTAIEHLDLIDGFNPHINLFRKEETKWDHAFQLYSGGAFWHDLTS